MNFIEELKWRNLFKDCTDEEGLLERSKTPMTLYCGFDATADSLHIGHLQQLILLLRYQQQGHNVIAVIGGATGMIGDPRPTSERQLQDPQQVAYNAAMIHKQVEKVIGNPQLTVLNNYDWLGQLSLIDFLRDYGKYFNVATMINKDIVASRLQTGISYTEFTYTILQGIDWYYLNQKYGCDVQIGGSDQWGNLISGSELIRKLNQDNRKVYGITSPLIMKSDGTKFGKSEGKNIWLDPSKTDSYTFYQFVLNFSDDDIEDFMKRLSLKSPAEIKEMISAHFQQPEKRLAQQALAEELTLLVFKEAGLENALKVTNALFHGDVSQLSAQQLEVVFENAKKVELDQDRNLIDVLVENKLIQSKREVRQLIENGTIQVNGQKVEGFDYLLEKDKAIEKQISIIKKGKKTFYIVKHL